jgi:soluble lytic murein transglycosylase
VKRRNAIVLMLALILLTAVTCLWWQNRLERRFVPQLEAAARRYSVDPLLVRAVAWRESRFHPEARGAKGEMGLMQVQEVTAQEWADAEHVAAFEHGSCLDPGTNAMAGAFYLGKLLKRYSGTDNPVPYALADYNAGRGNVLKWKSGAAGTNSAAFVSQIGFPSTRRYVKSILRRYAYYQFLARLGWA